MIQTMIYYGVSTDRILQTYQKGDHGSDVLNLKNRLKELGYYSPTATFDDEFNSVMVERVKMFQKNNHLKVSGKIDIMTNGNILMASSSTVKGQWYEEKKVQNVSTIYAALNDLRGRIVNNGNIVDFVTGTDFYFSKTLLEDSVLNDNVITLVWDRANCTFSVDGLKSMIHRSLGEMRDVSNVACGDYQSAPINMELFGKFAGSERGMYLETFDSVYVYEDMKDGTEWDVCPFILTQGNGKGDSVDNTLYVYARIVETNSNGSDQYTEMYISDPDMAAEIVNLLIVSVPDVPDAEHVQMLNYLID